MKNYLNALALVCLTCLLALAACKTDPPYSDAKVQNVTATRGTQNVDLSPPDWAKNANIYEVNLRQYTEEGTFKAFQGQLNRLKDMGVDILWLMPIHPISKTKRKGTMGSYYAVSDYKAVNPEFGTMQDFKDLVEAVHQKDMYIIIDWVPNHTGWDHKWIKENPNYYTRINGQIIDPINPETGKSWDWKDVADLNYDNKKMRRDMIDALEFWIKEDINIDGYRMDVAHGVPASFWTEVSTALHKIKKVFLLAEAEVPEFRNSGDFAMDYGWTFHHLLNKIAVEEKKASDIDKYLANDKRDYQKGYHMHFTSNHDENSWSGTEFERMGDGHATFAVLTATFDGMPLIYSGQEEPLKRRLEFFEKDPIGFSEYQKADFYRTLLTLKKKNKALWNGVHGGKLQRIKTGNDDHVFAFMREKDGDKVVVILNLTDQLQDIELEDSFYTGKYNNVFANSTQIVTKNLEMKLNPWDYIVLSNK